MVSYYGRRRTTDSDAGLTGNGTSNQRFSVFEEMPEHGWGHTFYLLAGKPIGGVTPTGRIAIATTDSNGNPSELMARSLSINFSANMSSGSDGTLYSSDLAFTEAEHGTSSGVMLYSGRRYALGFAVTGGALWHGMIAAANGGNNYDNNNLYRKDTGSSTPSEPIYTVASNEGVMSVAIGYDPNEPPATPTDRSPSGTISTTTPTFNSDFNDPNTNRGDKLKTYQIQLRQVGTTSLKWDDTITATGSEQSAAVTTTEYGGTALTAGNSYEWRIRHRDQFNAWSAWSSWLTFTIAAAGFVGQGSSPVGKQTTQTPGPFVNPWSHGAGLSTNAVQIRLVSGNTILQTSGTIAKTVANGANISISWAESGFTALAYGSEVAYEVRGRDTGNVWSDWSPNRTITINAYPNKPTITSPKDSVVVTARPKLIGKVTDPDNTAPLNTVQARIKSDAGAVLFTRNMTLKAGSLDTYEYQTTSTDLASFAAYKWDMRGYDGSLYGAYSNEARFVYSSGPSVTIDTPTAGQIFATSTPTMAWTAPTQSFARVDIYKADTGEYVRGTSLNNPTDKTWTVPAGYLRNGQSYTFVLTVYDASLLTGTATQDFSIVYATPAAVSGFAASALALAGDSQPSVAFLSWTAASDPTFVEYVLKRREAGTEAGDASEIVLRRIPSISQVTFTDTNPVSGKTYVYSLTKIIAQGLDLLESTPTEAELMVEFNSIIISSTQAGESYRAVLTYQESGKVDHRDDRSIFLPWGDDKPYIQIGPIHYHEVRATFRIVTDRHGSARDIIESLRSLKDRQIHEADTLCYRDGRGRRFFGYLTLSEQDDRLNTYTADLSFIETAFVEGEE